MRSGISTWTSSIPAFKMPAADQRFAAISSANASGRPAGLSTRSADATQPPPRDTFAFVRPPMGARFGRLPTRSVAVPIPVKRADTASRRHPGRRPHRKQHRRQRVPAADGRLFSDLALDFYVRSSLVFLGFFLRRILRRPTAAPRMIRVAPPPA